MDTTDKEASERSKSQPEQNGASSSSNGVNGAENLSEHIEKLDVNAKQESSEKGKEKNKTEQEAQKCKGVENPDPAKSGEDNKKSDASNGQNKSSEGSDESPERTVIFTGEDDLVEGCGEEGPLRGVFFAEFHHIQGPIIRCQLPGGSSELVTKDVFDSISVYIIPKQQLARRMITVNALGFKILGFPIILEDKKYKRNIFIFNVCFVCYPWSRTVQFEPALKKLSDYLVHLEQEQQFLSNENNNPILLSILQTIFLDLNLKRECKLVVESYTIQLQVIRTQAAPPVIHDHDVPVLMVPALSEYGKCDLTTNLILPCIDGISHVAAIAKKAGVETNLVKANIQNLVYHGVVRVIPMFRFGNVYCVTPNILKIKDDPALRKEFLEISSSDPKNPVTFRDAFRFVTSLTHGTRVRDLCQRFRTHKDLRLDVMACIQFLVLKGIIRRVHSYPYFDAVRHQQHLNSGVTPAELLKLFDGQRTLDELSCMLGVSPARLEDIIEKDAYIVLLKK